VADAKASECVAQNMQKVAVPCTVVSTWQKRERKRRTYCEKTIDLAPGSDSLSHRRCRTRVSTLVVNEGPSSSTSLISASLSALNSEYIAVFLGELAVVRRCIELPWPLAPSLWTCNCCGLMAMSCRLEGFRPLLHTGQLWCALNHIVMHSLQNWWPQTVKTPVTKGI
jgi:hypothetical protein